MTLNISLALRDFRAFVCGDFLQNETHAIGHAIFRTYLLKKGIFDKVKVMR